MKLLPIALLLALFTGCKQKSFYEPKMETYDTVVHVDVSNTNEVVVKDWRGGPNQPVRKLHLRINKMYDTVYIHDTIYRQPIIQHVETVNIGPH